MEQNSEIPTESYENSVGMLPSGFSQGAQTFSATPFDSRLLPPQTVHTAGSQNNNNATVIDFEQQLTSNAENTTLLTIADDIRIMARSLTGLKNDLRDDFRALTADIASVRTLAENNASANTRVEARVNSIESDISHLKSFQMDWNPAVLINEAVDRTRREANVIFYNVPQDSVGDANNLSSIVSKLENVSLEGAELTRLGKGTATDSRDAPPRPLLVHLNSRRAAINILKQREKLPRHISVSSDRTPAQRDAIKRVRAAVEAHNLQHPNQPMRLKFLNNEPTMVHLQPHETSRSPPDDLRSLITKKQRK